MNSPSPLSHPAFPITLRGAHYTLRTITPGESSEAFRRWAMDARMMTPMNLPARSLTAQQVSDYWASFDNHTKYFFGIFDAKGAPAGFWQVECDPLHNSATVQVAIDPAHQGKGCGLETALPLLDWVFGARAIAKMIVLTLPSNNAMQSLLARLGFSREGLMRQEIRNFTGEGRLDQLRYGLLATDWQDARTAALARLEIFQTQ